MAPKKGLKKQIGAEPRIMANTRMSRIAGSGPLWVRFGDMPAGNESHSRNGGSRIRGSGGEEKLVQPECKHRDTPFVPHLRAPQPISIVSRFVDALDGCGCGTIAVAHQKRKRRRSAICWLAEGIRKVRGRATDALLQGPFRLSQFAVHL